CPLLVPPKIDLVAPRCLPGDPHAGVLPRAIVEALVTEVRIIGPLGYIAGILIAPQRDVFAVTLVAHIPVKPKPVLQNRTAKRPSPEIPCSSLRCELVLHRGVRRGLEIR